MIAGDDPQFIFGTVYFGILTPFIYTSNSVLSHL